MEAKRELKLDCLEDLDGRSKAALTAKNRENTNTVLRPARTWNSSSLTQRGDNKNQAETSIQKTSSFCVKTGSPRANSIRKTKSLSAQFLVNIDELINNVTGAFDESDTLFSTTVSNEMGLFLLTGSSLRPSDEISDVMRLQNPCHEDGKMGKSSPIDEEDLNSCSWRKIHIGPTLPIYLNGSYCTTYFEDIKCKVTVKGKKHPIAEKSVVDGVTGSVSPGEVLALMGPSGGGKTTLLNLLSGRVKLNSGTITYNQQPYNKSLKQRIGFVLQDDIVFPHLTVKEALTYRPLLCLPNTSTQEQQKDRATHVITELGLERCEDTIIGGPFVKGISGSERKRLCIGNEILINPSLLFLDEPTSSLDSTTALRIVQVLHSIAEAGKTVVTTIHQPSSRLFNKFDKLILLGKGSSLYSGKASEAMVYFSSIGCSPLIAMNPAEFLIDLANGNMKDKSVPSELEDKLLAGNQKVEARDGRPSPVDVQVHEYLLRAYEARVTNMEETKKLLKPTLMVKVETEMQGWSIPREWGSTWCEQFSILCRRGLKERRHEYLSTVRVTQVISTAIIVGLLWWHSDASTPKRLQDQKGLLFFISVFWAFFPILTAIFTFPQERAMLVKESAVDMYRLSAYMIARNISDLPLDLVLPTLFLLMVYFMTGLKLSFTAFSLSLLTVFLSIVASQGLGLAIGASFMDVKKATTLASIIVMMFMLSGRFFIQNVPSFMSWVRSRLGSCESFLIKGWRFDWSGIDLGAILVMIIGYRILAYLFLRRMKLRQ
ncbi:ABC transporter G family member 22 [Camellia lanceoleosa]|uniref:ABC transporter G family member 22 n=1 Tax=Camellia lanceoleosa TaxID=1840588 RepID=A0ACC0HTE8_9ERIC|nr:ABC transporter G family member 22 [Camellia lanceoleosa]